MNREHIVRIYKLIIFGGLTEDDITLVLLNYCLEHNKPQYESMLFITILLKQRIFEPFLKEALEYYRSKYSIIKLQSVPINGHRNTINIY